MCVSIYVAYMILCHNKQQHLWVLYCASSSTTIAEGFVASIILQRSAISLFLFVRVRQFMQSHTYYNVAWESKAMCNYIICTRFKYMYYTASWWQSINLFAACCAVNFQPQCTSHTYECIYGSLFCFWCVCVCGFFALFIDANRFIRYIHRIWHLQVSLNYTNKTSILENHHLGILWC